MREAKARPSRTRGREAAIDDAEEALGQLAVISMWPFLHAANTNNENDVISFLLT